MARKLVSFDWAIKRLLRSKANFSILEGFLSELLFTDIKILELLESESNREENTEKSNRVDIKVKDSKDQIILIEIQYSRELDYLQRVLFSTSKAITEHLVKGTAYSNVIKVISINILYFDFGKGGDYIYHGTTIFEGMHNKTILQLNDYQKTLFKREKVADIYPEYYLIEVKNFNNVAKDTLDEWIYFLCNEEIEDSFQAKGLKEAKETLDVLKMDDQERREYEAYQDQLHRDASLYESTYILGKKEGKKIGVEEGKKIGAEEKTLLFVRISMKEGLKNEIIAKITGLSIDKIEAIRKELES